MLPENYEQDLLFREIRELKGAAICAVVGPTHIHGFGDPALFAKARFLLLYSFTFPDGTKH